MTNKKVSNWTIKDLLGCLDQKDYYLLKGQTNTIVNNVAPIDNSTSNDLTFCSTDDFDAIVSILRSNAGIILCKRKLEGLVYPLSDRNAKNISQSTDYSFLTRAEKQQLLVFVDNPRLLFIKLANKIRFGQNLTVTQVPRISKQAAVSESAQIGKNSHVGDFTTVDDECIIGDSTIIGQRVTLKNCIIGDNCYVQSGCVIGEDGFAFERVKDTNELEPFPHYGKVIIKDNVNIFANCSIARGSLSDTVINEGTKIDSLCHLAHNSSVGKNSQLAAGVIIGGSVKVGDSCWIGLNSTVKHKLKIGDNVIIGSGSSVIYDVTDKDIVAGVPAKSIKHKITISDDMLFLMRGQRIKEGKKNNHQKKIQSINQDVSEIGINEDVLNKKRVVLF